MKEKFSVFFFNEEDYDSVKKEKNYYDYDDMLELCLQILKDNQITLEFLREKYKYVFP